jgi:hypothetical protein
MTVAELIEQLSQHNPKSVVRFSIADDESLDDGERWFVEDGIEDMFGNEKGGVGVCNQTELTICLIGRSNLSG